MPFPDSSLPERARGVRVSALMLCCAALALLGGCGGESAPAAWNADPADVLVERGGCTDSVRVDLYLDGTSSMSGYAAADGSVYVAFLDNLESAISGAWTDDSLHFYKFGETIRRIDRAEFRQARDAAFYQERGIFMRTQIDGVIDRAAAGRVGVVVTDLFQDDGDINAVVARIKERVFQRGLAAGVLALRSPFDGTIYDAPSGSYTYTSSADPDTYRPFYALMFGDAACLGRLYEALRSQPFVSGEHFLLLDRTLVEDYRVTLDKARGDDGRGLNRRAAPGDAHFAFDVRPDSDGGALEAEIILDRAETAPDVDASRIELEVFRKPMGPNAADSVRTEDLRLRGIERRGDTLAVALAYTLGEEAGRYTYLAQLRARDIGGLAAPDWVRDLSSAHPSAEADPNKTLNLDKFVTDLTQAAASAYRPLLARFMLDVTKR